MRNHVVVELRVPRDRLHEGPRFIQRRQHVQAAKGVFSPTYEQQCLSLMSVYAPDVLLCSGVRELTMINCQRLQTICDGLQLRWQFV